MAALGTESALLFGGAAEAGLSAAVQPLRGRDELRQSRRRRDARASADRATHTHRHFGNAFLTAPEDYDGGELLVEDTYGVHSVKLPAGDMVIYPATSLHRVTPITRGTRVSSFFWIQSMIRDDAQRRCCSTWTWRWCA